MVRKILFLLVISFSAFSQTHIVNGEVVDSETGLPLPFVSIGLIGTTRGTSSNLNGEFTLSVSGIFSIRVSCLGYETLELDSLSPNELVKVKLKPSFSQLNELVVFSKKVNPKKIVRKAFDAISSNYNSNPFVEKYFYRHYCKDDSVYGRLIEASVDVWKRKGYKSTQKAAGEKEEIRVTHLRRSFDKTPTAQGHVPIAINSILQANIVGYQTATPSTHLSYHADVSNLKVDIDKYTFSFAGITTYDGKEVYEVAYSLKKDSVLTTTGYVVMPQSIGSLFITTKEYAFVKTMDVKFWGMDTIKTTSYYTPYKGKYYPYHLIRDGKSTTRDHSTHWFHVELMALEIQTDDYEEFYGKQPSKFDLLRIPYDSVYWNNNTTLKTTPLEDEIIRDLGSGVSLNEQFLRYQQFEMNRVQSGNGDEKFSWLKEESKGKKALYVGFWSSACTACIVEIESARKWMKKYQDNIVLVLLSLDSDETKWKKTIERYNLNAENFIHYRLGEKSMTASSYQLTQLPHYLLIDKKGNTINVNARHPDNPLLIDDLELLIKEGE